MRQLKLPAFWIGLQVVFFAVWTAREEFRVHHGGSILVKTVPVDPRDLLRGQYIQLNYEFSSQNYARERDKTFPTGSTAWVILAPQGVFHSPVRGSAERPAGLAPGEVAIRGRVADRRLEFGIERYFVPEGTETPDQRDITVRLRVGSDGSPRIEKVYVKGTPWP